jgi:hypothetical protein
MTPHREQENATAFDEPLVEQSDLPASPKMFHSSMATQNAPIKFIPLYISQLFSPP